MVQPPIRFIVPGRPIGMQRTGGGKTVRPFIQPRSRGQMERVRQICIDEMGSRPMMIGPLKLTVWAIRAIPKSWPVQMRKDAMAGHVWDTSPPDAKNIAWLIEDALNGIAWRDDAEIAILQSAKRYGGPERTDVLIEAIDQPRSAIDYWAKKRKGYKRADG